MVLIWPILIRLRHIYWLMRMKFWNVLTEKPLWKLVNRFGFLKKFPYVSINKISVDQKKINISFISFLKLVKFHLSLWEFVYIILNIINHDLTLTLHLFKTPISQHLHRSCQHWSGSTKKLDHKLWFPLTKCRYPSRRLQKIELRNNRSIIFKLAFH